MKKRLFAALLAAIVLLGAFRLFQYRGYRTFVGDYFAAMESGDQDAILRLYDWDYVQADNARIVAQYGVIDGIDPTLFTSETLEDYVYNHDKYYRFLIGETIESWKITDSSRNWLSLAAPCMEIEAFVVCEGNAQDIIVELEMERGDDGWYMTGTEAYYASAKTENG